MICMVDIYTVEPLLVDTFEFQTPVLQQTITDVQIITSKTPE